MPHQVIHTTRNSKRQRLLLVKMLLSADDRTIFEGPLNGRNYTKNRNHSLWAKVTIEEVAKLVRELGI